MQKKIAAVNLEADVVTIDTYIQSRSLCIVKVTYIEALQRPHYTNTATDRHDCMQAHTNIIINLLINVYRKRVSPKLHSFVIFRRQINGEVGAALSDQILRDLALWNLAYDGVLQLSGLIERGKTVPCPEDLAMQIFWRMKRIGLSVR